MTKTSASACTELRRLAKSPRLTRISVQLEELADALDPSVKRDVHNWANVDLFSAFLHQESVGPPRRFGLGRLLDVWVQALFFMPIFVTWLALMEATRAYRHTLDFKAFATQSFLEGWQTGFHGFLYSAFYLDRVALYVVLSIGVLVISMTVQSIYHNRVDEDEPGKLYEELARSLTSAQLELAPIRLGSSEHISDELHNATMEFAKTATKIREVGEIARSTQDQASKGLNAVNAALAEVKDLTKAAQEASKNVDKSSQSIGQRLTDIKSMTKAIVDAETGLAQRIDRHGDDLSASANGFSTAIRDAVEGNQKQMSAAVESSSTKIASALASGAGQVRDAFAEISVAGAQYTHQVEQAADVLGLAGGAINRLPGAIAELQQCVAEVGGQMENLNRAIGRAKEVMPSAADIPADLRSTLHELKAAATALQSASAVFRDGTRPVSTMVPPPRSARFWRRARP